MPEKALIAEELEQDGEVCALGAVGKKRGIDMAKLDPTEPEDVAEAFGISAALAREIVYVNDEWCSRGATPEKRWQVVRDWVQRHIIAVPA